MKITKPGDPSKIDPLWVATCSKCGCEMEAKRQNHVHAGTVATPRWWEAGYWIANECPVLSHAAI